MSIMTIFYVHEESRFRSTDAAAKIRTAVEKHLNCAPLNGIITEKSLIRVNDPDSLVRTNLDRHKGTELSNGIEERWVTLSFRTYSNMEFGNPPIKVLAHDRGEHTIDHTPSLFSALAPLSQAVYGDAWTPKLLRQFSQRYIEDENGRPRQIDQPNIPLTLGWLNYWSEAALQALNATGIDLVAEGLAVHSAPCVGGQGGIVWQVTEDILDIQRPDHDARVQAIFSAFPALLGTPYEPEPFPEDWYVEFVAEHEARLASGYYETPEFRALVANSYKDSPDYREPDDSENTDDE